jgi:short-subunit dehydrogenase
MTLNFVYFFFKYRSLAAECVSHGVYIQSLCPGYVVSKLSGFRKPSVLVPTPEKYVISALNRVALPFTTGYWSHELQVKQLKIIHTNSFLFIFIF